MGIGACVALLAVGATLTFATEWSVQGIDIDAVGVILMIAGTLGLVVTMQIFKPRSRPAPPPQPYQQQQPGGYYQPQNQYPPQYSQQPYPPTRSDGYR